MKFRLLSESGGVKRYSIVLSKGDEVMSGLTDFARQNKVTSASFTATVHSAALQSPGLTTAEFKAIPINEQVELASMNRLPNCSSGLPEPCRKRSAPTSDS